MSLGVCEPTPELAARQASPLQKDLRAAVNALKVRVHEVLGLDREVGDERLDCPLGGPHGRLKGIEHLLPVCPFRVGLSVTEDPQLGDGARQQRDQGRP